MSHSPDNMNRPHPHPQQGNVIWNWPDTRPITTWELFGTQFWSPKNPDCFNLGAGNTDATDFEFVANKVFNHTDKVIKNTLAINGQGTLIHGLTWRYQSRNYPNQSHIQFGNFNERATMLNQILTNGDHTGKTLLRAVCDIVRAAGLMIGCSARPAYARGTWDKLDVNISRYQGHARLDRKIVFNYMRADLDRAYEMGIRAAYVDTPGEEDYIDEYFGKLIEEFQTRRPSDPFLFIPECTMGNVNHPSMEYVYKYGPAWGRGAIKTSLSDKGYRSYFSVDHADWVWNNKGIDGIKSQIRRSFEVGHIVSPNAWYNSRGYKATVEVIEERAQEPPGDEPSTNPGLK